MKRQYASNYQQHKRTRYKDEESYFEDDDDDRRYRSSYNNQTKSNNNTEEEIDPLDAFMMNLEKEQQQSKKAEKQKQEIIESEDHALEAYINGVQNPDVNNAILQAVRKSGYDSDEEVYATAKAIDQHERNAAERKSKKKQVLDYDSDENPVLAAKKRYSRSLDLEKVKHDEIQYEEIRKNLYLESDAVRALTDEQVATIRKKMEITTSGQDLVRPVQTISQLNLDPKLETQIKFEKPTPIQAQAVPAILSGRDVIGIAKTGSGKTFAYLWPLIVHLLAQKATPEPHAIAIAPTRELCQQIFAEATRLCGPFQLRIVPLFGGVEKKDQFRDLKKGCDLIICTPGRMIDVYQQKGFKMDHISFVVIDEADQLFTLGFESQIRDVMQQIRPDRQTVMFSATFDPRIENSTYALLTNPLRIQIGTSHNADIKQNIIVVPTKDRFDWLAKFFRTKHERVLVFCNARVACDELARRLNDRGTTAMSIHGELTQEERGDILDAFRSGVVSVLVATDIASRGLDVPELNYVVNYDIAKDVESHVHRIGRTGRAGLKGEAFTIVGMDETNSAPIIVRALEASNQAVPVDLLHVAMKNPNFQATRKTVPQGLTTGHFVRASSEAKKPVEGLSPMMRGFVKPKNEDTILKPEKKSFSVIPAKNPQPLPEVKPKFEIIQPKKIEIVPPVAPQVPSAQAPNPTSYIQTNAPPMAGYQQNLIYQQYRDYLSRKESEK